jgi:hypothetical protein
VLAQPGELLVHESAVQVWRHGWFFRFDVVWIGGSGRWSAAQPPEGEVVAPVGERVHPWAQSGR